MYDIIIIGAGPAGMTAALYARRAEKSVLLIEKSSFGGQITHSPKVENYPGFLAMSGVEFADPNVFKGANYIVTPTEKNSIDAIRLCKDLGEELGFLRISELSPESHDEMIAFLSQLTHIIAVTLMNCNDSDGLEKYTGDSFRDLTRIAKINDRMWSELFLMNKQSLLTEMDRFIAEFSEFREYLANGDGKRMREKMRSSSARRSLFDKPAK